MQWNRLRLTAVSSFFYVVCCYCTVIFSHLMQNGGIRIDGRKLFIVTAVSKEDAVKLKVNKAKVETGTRNLYLAREGCESTLSNPFLNLFSQPFWP